MAARSLIELSVIAVKPSEARSLSESEGDSGQERRRHKKRRQKHRPSGRSEDEGSDHESSRRPRHKKSKHSRDDSQAPAESPEGDGGKHREPKKETDEEYDARLEREEKERFEAERKQELERLKTLQQEVSTKNGVRFKGTASCSVCRDNH